MSSGNTYGLGEISHFGAFQRVGGKAGGFINKKFFHPSTLRNQEKLWLAMTADEREKKKQAELEKRREEERQVEELRKQMYLSGQGSATDVASAAMKDKMKEGLTGVDRAEKKAALDEEKRRREMVKSDKRDREAAAEGGFSSGDEEDADDGSRVLAKSRYEEDVFVGGHTSVWGSWYSEEKEWGFACCKLKDVNVECPLAPEEKEEEKPAKPSKRSKRRRKGKNGEEAEGGEDEEEGVPGLPGGLQGEHAKASASSDRSADPASLIDQRMLEAAEKRKEKRIEEERKKEEIKKSRYLADLLSDPTG